MLRPACAFALLAGSVEPLQLLPPRQPPRTCRAAVSSVVCTAAQRSLARDLSEEQRAAAGVPKVAPSAAEHAQVLLADLIAVEELSGAAPDTELFERAIRAHAEAGLVEECLSLLRRMRRARKTPSLESYALVVSALSAAGRPREAARWLRRVVEPSVSQLLLRRSKAPPRRSEYNRAMAAYGAAGLPHEVMETLRTMVGEGEHRPDLRSFNALIAAHANAGELGPRRRLLQDQTSRSLLGRSVGQPDRAAAVMAEMRLAPNITADIRAHSALVEAFAVAGRVAEAAGALQAARDAGLAPTVVTYASVAKGHAMRGEYEAASGVLDQMEADGVAPNVPTFHALLSVCARAGEADEVTFSSMISLSPGASTAPARAAEWLGAMKQLGLQPDAQCFNKVLACCARARLPELADEWLDKMEVAGVPPNLVSYSTTIAAYAKTAQPDEAAAVLRRMTARGIAPDTILLNQLLESLVRASRPAQAAALLSRFRRGELGPPPDCCSYTIVLSALAREGDVARAASWFRTMTAEDGIAPDLMCYNGLIRGFAGQGELDEAMRLYDRLRREGLSPDEWTYGPLLDGARAARASRLARSLGAQMLGRSPPVLSSFCLVALRRSIGASGLRAVCRECGVLDQPAVRQALGKAPLQGARRG
ncbi:hypothetical protein EMIHUDRAFT_469985 [Emiliania huxleyi CCMP1516]|uniref:Pentatricopeptide repeat-containing protein-mitochondrial domain-containing protein n=2 Tax=Emiliania huxleyi TaxID=2903 RepID=A0A0D3J9P8_EMIH1|nr:hypothetical protein EMIHUDRAFT_469985 [Emiliania huxleyi CCMP1516]EOD20233.1 hypothetical protein EMIHUDRAFT_469985 [Emiliania huxleyi CCMP1516]|eukprot:XP_005772662.1 hypothetical protein EMIHUDRAFT_469985 [Emiliania huxleyi CCMP1516]